MYFALDRFKAFNPYGALAAYRPALATAVLTPIAGAGAATVPWGAAVETH